MDLARVPEKFRNDLQQAVTTLLEYGARDVYLFGSLTTNTWQENSDIDLAIAGMEPRLFLKAYALASRNLVHELDDTKPLFSLLSARSPDSIEIRAAGSIMQSVYNEPEVVFSLCVDTNEPSELNSDTTRKLDVSRQVRRAPYPEIKSPIDVVVYHPEEFAARARELKSIERIIAEEGIPLYG